MKTIASVLAIITFAQVSYCTFSARAVLQLCFLLGQAAFAAFSAEQQAFQGKTLFSPMTMTFLPICQEFVVKYKRSYDGALEMFKRFEIFKVVTQ